MKKTRTGRPALRHFSRCRIAPLSFRVVALALALVVGATVLGACAHEISENPGGNGGSAPVTVDPSALPSYRLVPLWERNFERPVAAALSSGGENLAVGSSKGSGSGEQWGITVFDSAGQPAWKR